MGPGTMRAVMRFTKTMKTPLLAAGVALLVLGGAAQPLRVRAETCTPLEVVGAETGNTEGAKLTRGDTRVKKSISPAGTFVTANNWNTDFTVPSDSAFNRYVATVVPDSDGQYDIRFALKYSDQTSEKFFDRTGVSLGKGKRYSYDAKPRGLKDQPYQVNFSFGGPVSIGKSYTVTVLGCK
ncbi:hypothetical protein GKIL_1017 [Gloeobacter kilaueensis JS1]|uniref:Uncharacterized protein n=2 Tax=Gloeobacter TaxID=33071 RepID=U5QEF5_GLOK1|nr:hypothetical protein GKIL_1017 [Gloeobacter kilaueensis JS1]